MVDISTTYMGLKMKSPLIAGSSGLTNKISDIIEMEKMGAGAVVLKSLFEEEIRLGLEKDMKKMGQSSSIYPETMDYYDNYDIEDELTQYLKLIADCKRECSLPVIASINCVTADKWPYYASTLVDAGADALELNVFRMPSDFEPAGENNEKVYFDVVDAIKKEVKVPVALKVSYYFTNLANFLHRLSNSGIEGMVLFNRFYSPDIDLDKMELINTHVYSRPSDLPVSLRWIAIMAGRVGCDLAASTGVHDGNGLIKQILAGADAVQVASTLYKSGIIKIQQMLQVLTSWMGDKGYENLDSMRGLMSYQKVENPAAYERVQFMKHFAGK